MIPLLFVAIGMVTFTVGEVPREYLPPDKLGAGSVSFNNAYLPPENTQNASHKISKEYLPPNSENIIAGSASLISESINQPIEPAHVLDKEGYHYKTPLYRHRRDVNELTSQQISFQNEDKTRSGQHITNFPADITSNSASFIPDTLCQANDPAHVLADDGYHYKTMRQLRYRQRRDVSDLKSKDSSLTSNDFGLAQDYLPPKPQGINVASASVPQNVVVNFASAVQGKVPSNDYLPPPELLDISSSSANLPPVTNAQADDPTHVRADDGYRYKTIRRLRYRQRRDVSELKSKDSSLTSNDFGLAQDYLPPKPQGINVASASVPQNVVVNFASAVQGKIPSNDYLPPPELLDISSSSANLPPVTNAQADDPTHVLADDGYRYKTIRRLRYRQRRDVSELKSKDSSLTSNDFGLAQDYLPPKPQGINVASASVPQNVVVNFASAVQGKVPSNDYLPPPELLDISSSSANLPPVTNAQADDPTHVLADDGYRYKTIRRLRYRQRRDVSELKSKDSSLTSNDFGLAQDYLPPKPQGINVASASVPQNVVVNFASAVQGKVPSNDYLPPPELLDISSSSANLPPVTNVQADDPAHVLADDGYRYKTIRRLRYRQRRDINDPKQTSQKFLRI